MFTDACLDCGAVAAWCPALFVAESLHADQAHAGHSIQGWSSTIRERAGRASQARTHTPPDWVAALIQTDGPKDGSSVSIMVSLQIIYISPLLLFCPQAHEASFSMLLLAGGDERAIQ